ncbi:hypothetical protein FKV25_10950 [Lysobacter aestuarii]|uniref:DUF3857 domain-containing protein n=1 Tax=Marilutibacter aestuarii TaxID=1706195 RepID=A0A508A3K4_9GAMM|nr:hypothetical protein [Lysobacter aestuarii]TQD43321.1 hypothetical protein FKV25_10950 [Lysobacter aestuarii]
MRLFPLPCLLLVAALSVPVFAQDRVVIQAENVRYDYAQVLRVTPVYQTLTATRVEERCDQTPRPEDEGDSRLSRMVGAVKDVFTRGNDEADEDAGAATTANCRSVPVEREFQRPIAYDVDYLYKGAKFRSRLPEDPGNRLRIRVSITPVATSVERP